MAGRQDPSRTDSLALAVRRLFLDHSLSITLGLTTVALQICRVMTARYDWDDRSGALAEAVVMAGEWAPQTGAAFIIVVATKFLHERGSPESK